MNEPKELTENSNHHRSAYNYLRQLRPVVRALSVEARKTVVHDYCNYLLFGVTDSPVQRLQAVQNAAARLVSGTRRSEHITPVLRQLYWLPVRQRIEFKMAVLVYSRWRMTVNSSPLRTI